MSTYSGSGTQLIPAVCHPFDLQTLPPCGPMQRINRELELADPGLITVCFVGFVDVSCQTAPVCLRDFKKHRLTEPDKTRGKCAPLYLKRLCIRALGSKQLNNYQISGYGCVTSVLRICEGVLPFNRTHRAIYASVAASDPAPPFSQILSKPDGKEELTPMQREVN